MANTLTNYSETYLSDWPPKEYYVNQHEVTHDQYRELGKIVNSRAGETEIEGYLKKNPSILALTLSLFQTGHHASWVIPKQNIRPHLKGVYQGMIPDYILAGKNSDGISWYVLELKGANENIFKNSGERLCFSSTTNKGYFQLLEYLDHCSKSQLPGPVMVSSWEMVS